MNDPGPRPSITPLHLRRPTKIDLPIDSHPSVIRGDFISKDEGLMKLAQGAMKAGYEAVERVNMLAPVIVQKARLAKAALPHFESAAKGYGTAIETLKTRREQLAAQVLTKLGGDAKDHTGAEVRSYLRSTKEPLAAVMGMINNGDQRSVAAIMNAQPYLSGLDDKQALLVKDAARKKFYPAEDGLLGDITANLARVETANNVFLATSANLIREWRDSDDAILAKELGT